MRRSIKGGIYQEAAFIRGNIVGVLTFSEHIGEFGCSDKFFPIVNTSRHNSDYVFSSIFRKEQREHSSVDSGNKKVASRL